MSEKRQMDAPPWAYYFAISCSQQIACGADYVEIG